LGKRLHKLSQKVTITDIANALNVNPGTVSRALADSPKISDDTKKAVLEMARKLNYRPNRIAASLRSGKSHVIGVMIPSAEINFFGSVVHGIESIANLHGYNVLIYQSNESEQNEAKGIETFLSARVDGILASIAKNTHDYAHFEDVKDRGIPLVFFDRVNYDLEIPAVVIDDYMGAFIATGHLIKQGYNRVAHITGPQHLNIFSDRVRGYQAALRANHMLVNQQYVYEGNVSIESGKNAVDYFFNLPEPPDAIFAVEDFTALGVIKRLKEKGLEIPAQFGVIGFANEGFGEHITPSLSTIDQQTVTMGQEAIKLLLKICEKTTDQSLVQTKVVLDPIPIFRESSMKKGIN
jgi:LacI family transcriptional regulator